MRGSTGAFLGKNRFLGAKINMTNECVSFGTPKLELLWPEVRINVYWRIFPRILKKKKSTSDLFLQNTNYSCMCQYINVLYNYM